MSKMGPKETQLRELRDRQMAQGGAYGWAMGFGAVAPVRQPVQARPTEPSKEIAVVDESGKEVAEVTNLSVKAVPVDLVERMDTARGALSRNEFIKRALEYMVAHVELLTEGS